MPTRDGPRGEAPDDGDSPPALAARSASVVLLGAACLAAGIALGWAVRGRGEPGRADRPAADTAAAAGAAASPPSMTRLHGYRFVQPLLECDLPAGQQALDLGRLSAGLEDTVRRQTAAGALRQAAIYYRDLESSAHVEVGESATFSPASLFKVPLLVSALREAEKDSSYLDRQVPFHIAPEDVLPQNVRPRRELGLGQSYTLWAYLEQTVVESDNRAAEMIADYVTPAEYARTFRDLGLTPPDLNGEREPQITVAEAAAFFRVLFNASYLGPEMSERALGLLANVRYDRGLVAGVPAGVTVAHKFGERRLQRADGGPGAESPTQLHDCGVVYVPGRPYVLCVMTQGQDFAALAEAIREVSAQVYHHVDAVGRRQGVAASGSASGASAP